MAFSHEVYTDKKFIRVPYDVERKLLVPCGVSNKLPTSPIRLKELPMRLQGYQSPLRG